MAGEIAQRDLAQEASRLRSLRDAFWKGLREMIPGIQWNGSAEQGLPNTLNVVFPGRYAPDLLDRMPGIAASVGAACHAGETRPSQVLLAMGLTEVQALGSIRYSVGRLVKETDIPSALEQIFSVCCI